MTGEKAIKTLLELSKYEFLNIDFTPSWNNDAIKILSKYQLEPCKYYYNEGYVSLNYNDVESFLIANTNKHHLEKLIHTNSEVKVIDSIAGNSDNYDYFVVGKFDEIHKLKQKETTLHSERAIEIIRLLSINEDCIYANRNKKISEFYYYLFRFKKLFSEYQPAWTIVLHANGYGLDSKVEDHFDSLAHRLEMICRAVDKISIYSLKRADNGSQANILYHFGYLVMLITGVYDDLAWILKLIYKVELKKWDVTLRGDGNKKLFKFFSDKNEELYDFLTDVYTQDLINLLYPIRDALQHRQFVKGTRYSEQNAHEKNLIQLPEEAVSTVKIVSDDLKDYGLVSSHSNVYLFDPELFTSKIIENTVFIVNQILSLIDWEEITESLPKEKMEQIELSNKKLERGLWHFLRLGEEPIYF